MKIKKIKHRISLDYIEQEFYRNLQFVFLGDDFPWFLKKESDLGDPQTSYYFTHIFYQNNIAHSNYFNFIQTNLLNFIKINSLISVRAFMFPSNKEVRSIEIENEFDFKHNQAIYFVNTNNGNTVLSDGTKVTPRENSILFMESSDKQHSENCTDKKAKVMILIDYF
jgi:hypothetical protein